MDFSRRDFLKLTAAGAVWAAGTPRSHAAATPQHPNLLVIHTDEHSLRTLGCYRALLPREAACVWGADAVLDTPNIDWLARNGVLCDRWYATSPVCTPSRASMVSGRYPQNTGAHTNDLPMRDDVVTFAEVLRRAGYATGYAGKWHLDGPPRPGWTPARKFGFDDNTYMFNRGHWKQLEETDAGPRVKAMDNKGNPTYSAEGADARSFTTDFLTDKTIAFIRRNSEKPFCFMLSLPDPHGPNTVRQPYDVMFDKIEFKAPASAQIAGSGLPSWALPAGEAGEPFGNDLMMRYFGMVKCIDDNVGRLLDCLREAGILDRTIVVFTSDHGDLCGEHGRFNKGVPLETSARVPFIVYAPGRVKPGAVVREALGMVDFKPTILGLMGRKSPDPVDGRDASPLLVSGNAPEGWRNAAVLRHAGGQWLAAVNSRFKLVFSSNADPVLFNLEADPLEMKNVLAEPAHRETVRELGQALLDYAQACKEPMLQDAAIASDLHWAAQGSGPYLAPPSRAQSAAPASMGKSARKAARQAGKGKKRQPIS